ncbi:unnamed protein product [Litomosoides sigmodontis]|uniref:Uncharacterized protein n=1 Tax=Litomosoides sigmodontis TaxID=42156 RepID=A0A3P6S495_LITSI|nr:unnamed protein product [Litomosoides sigmodontis]
MIEEVSFPFNDIRCSRLLRAAVRDIKQCEYRVSEVLQFMATVATSKGSFSNSVVILCLYVLLITGSKKQECWYQ